MPTVTDTIAFCPDCELLYCTACSPRGARCAGCEDWLCPDCAAEAFRERKGLCSFCAVLEAGDEAPGGKPGASWAHPGPTDLAAINEARARARAYAHERAVGQAMRRAKKSP